MVFILLHDNGGVKKQFYTLLFDNGGVKKD